LNYVSCSPYRVPVARLAAAQAALEAEAKAAAEKALEEQASEAVKA
jgi:pyruvate,orthophosphate dikinase